MHTGHGACRRQVEGVNASVRVRATHEARMQDVGKPNVIDKATAPRQQRSILEARDTGAE
jgi:hypothetical protein